MAGGGRPFSVGWHPVDPGPPPRSRLLDTPPAPVAGRPYEPAHTGWRSAVEADEARLQRAHEATPVWHALPLPEDAHVLPVLGGTPAALEQLTTTLVLSAVEHALDGCRVVNLSGWSLSGLLRDQMRNARRNRAHFEEVSPRGSTVNLFGNPDPTELVALLADTLRVSADRSGGRQVQLDRRELERVVKMLRGGITLERMADAVDVALGASTTPASLSTDELRDLRDYAAGVVGQRRGTQDRLADLHLALESLNAFGQHPTRRGDVVGAGSSTIRWYDVNASSGTGEAETGRELLARAVLQTFTRPGRDELLVVLGAERLADDVRDGYVDAAERLGKRVVLAYTQVTDAARRMLGYAGSSLCIFLRMPNPADAAVGAEFIGREYKFVVNGISIAEGSTQDWSTAYGTSTSRGRSRGTSSTHGGGTSGKTLSFSHSFGTTVSSSFEQGTSTTTSSGGSSSSTRTVSTGRVHEFVVEPEVFQQMPEETMMIAANGTVIIASCENALRRSPLTAPTVLMLP